VSTGFASKRVCVIFDAFTHTYDEQEFSFYSSNEHNFVTPNKTPISIVKYLQKHGIV